MFRFTIRDLLWLMVVVAVALTVWTMERRRFTAKDRETLKQINAVGLQFETIKNGGPPPGPNAVLVPGVSHP
jgi:hypothetical protein